MNLQASQASSNSLNSGASGSSGSGSGSDSGSLSGSGGSVSGSSSSGGSGSGGSSGSGSFGGNGHIILLPYSGVMNNFVRSYSLNGNILSCSNGLTLQNLQCVIAVANCLRYNQYGICQ